MFVVFRVGVRYGVMRICRLHVRYASGCSKARAARLWETKCGLVIMDCGDCDVVMEYFRLISQYNEDYRFRF